MGDIVILITTKLSSIIQGYTKDAGQDMALEQLIQPTIPSSQVKSSLHGTDWEYLQRLIHILSIRTILPCMVPNILVGTGVPLLATPLSKGP